ncbi:hypothetical protein [Polaribacter ponticola]|uniref:Gluconate 2-dehydrogenase subunit 3 family protein n=1 Tax=Polaribacter ponticola TaxID=2978475 RepID=A0ABT5SB54_9FLAO|nr:hypothetical protein [Polaribacter sp. MSW5]MDD7915303.1 hypothetical protein [Polaribacter sp. MSW5]
MMDRRKALKNIALAFGCVVATPTLINVLSACTSEVNKTNYLFLSQNEALIVKRLSENILPKIHFPSIVTMNLTVFVDQLFHFTEDKKDKEIFKLGCKEFEKNSL